jgi:hypothetical protein
MNTPIVNFRIPSRLVHLVRLGRKRVERAALRFSLGFAAPSSLSPRLAEPAPGHIP